MIIIAPEYIVVVKSIGNNLIPKLSSKGSTPVTNATIEINSDIILDIPPII